MLRDRLNHLADLDHDGVVAELAALIAEGPAADGIEPETPAELEHFAAHLLVLLEQSPEDSVALLLDALAARAARGEARSTSLLGAMSVLADEPLRGALRERTEQIAGAVDSGLVDGVGALSIEAAIDVEDGRLELIVAVLGRPGIEQRQVAVFGIEHAATGGALFECRLGAPDSAERARAALIPRDGAPAPSPIAAVEVIRRVNAAARAAADAEIELDFDAGVAFACLAPALERDGAQLLRPAVRMPQIADDDEDATRDADDAPLPDAGDQPSVRRAIAALLDDLERHARAHHPPDSPMWAHGDFVASTMLEWKVEYQDGRLEHWTRGDLAEFMLDYFPRKVTMDLENLDAVPECALGFLAFLNARGTLTGDSLEALGGTLAGLRGEFRRRARDHGNYGLAKSMAMQMLIDGVDMADPRAVDAWMVDFNTRPRAVRDAVVGPATDRMLALARGGEPLPSGRARARRGRRSARKARKAARRRNRRG